MTATRAETPELSNWYYTLASVLIIFGILGLLSIGAPFLTLGVAMFCLAPLAKRRSTVVLPILISIATFWAIVFALGPVTSSETGMQSTVRDGAQRAITKVSTVCDQEPNAFAIAIVAAFGIGLGSWVIRRSTTP